MSQLLIVAAALVVLLGLAAVVGVVEGRALRTAWARIAEQRRALVLARDALAAERAQLTAWELALADESERHGSSVM